MSDIKEEYTSEGEYIIDSSSIIGPYPDYNIGIGSSTGINGTYSTSAIGSSGGYLYNNNTSNAVWTTNSTANWNTISPGTTQPTIKVSGDAEFEGKVMINGRNISEFLETISKRLAILVPDPEKLEHFEALKKAYDHYKLLEALCELPKETKE
jgi:polygalacturonase